MRPWAPMTRIHHFVLQLPNKHVQEPAEFLSRLSLLRFTLGTRFLCLDAGPARTRRVTWTRGHGRDGMDEGAGETCVHRATCDADGAARHGRTSGARRGRRGDMDETGADDGDMDARWMKAGPRDTWTNGVGTRK